MMRITFLGTSHGVPEANQRCSCTMIEAGGRYYFVDMGVLPIEQLRTRMISPDLVKGVFVTHMHGDHTNGLLSFVDLISWYFQMAEPVICLPSMAGVKVISDWLSVNQVQMRPLEFRQVEPGTVFDDGVLKVTAVATQHCENSFAYVAEADGKRVLFTGDLRRPDVDFPQIAREKEMDLVICEAAHFPATEYEPILRECKVKKVCVNHYAPWNIPYIQKLEGNMKELPVVLVHDGTEIVL